MPDLFGRGRGTGRPERTRGQRALDDATNKIKARAARLDRAYPPGGGDRLRHEAAQALETVLALDDQRVRDSPLATRHRRGGA